MPSKNVKSPKINQIYNTIEETFPREDSSQLIARKVDDTDRDWFAEALSNEQFKMDFRGCCHRNPHLPLNPFSPWTKYCVDLKS